MPRKIELSHRTIIFTVFFLISLWFLYFIRDIILHFLIALLITSILNPLVTKFSKFRIPRGLSIFLVYLVVIGIIITVVSSILPPLLEQTTSFANSLPKYIGNLGLAPAISQQVGSEVLSLISALPAQAVKFVLGVFSNVLNIITVLILAFYLLLSHYKIGGKIEVYLGKEKAEKINDLIEKVEFRLGKWTRGELTLMLMVGLANYLGLRLLGIPFALPLAILSGLLEIVPYVGPVVAAVPSVLIGLGISPLMGFATAALAFLVQQLENYVFVPKVMQKSAGISPIITIMALAIGFRIAGIIGVLISIPTILILQVLFEEYLKNRQSA